MKASQSHIHHQILQVSNFDELASTPFHSDKNAMCWPRELSGDFSEIVDKVEVDQNMTILDEDQLHDLHLSTNGQLARDVLLKDLELLRAQGADPILNLIKCYEKDDVFPFFPTDVYSFHVDRSPIPTSTFLCTYHGEASEILPNAQAEQKVLIPEIREGLKKLYDGSDEGFESFLSEYFFDLHYRAKVNASPINLGQGHLWRLAVDHPESPVLPCVHRAPDEKDGLTRLMLIC